MITRIMGSFQIRSLISSWKSPRHRKMLGKTAKRDSKVDIHILFVLFSYLVSVSYLEIYNEEVRDLLGKDRDKSLEVK